MPLLPDSLYELYGLTEGFITILDSHDFAAKIDSEVRKQYLLGFTPSGQGDVKYRVVVVSVAKPGSWDVRTRRGYRGSSP